MSAHACVSECVCVCVCVCVDRSRQEDIELYYTYHVLNAHVESHVLEMYLIAVYMYVTLDPSQIYSMLTLAAILPTLLSGGGHWIGHVSSWNSFSTNYNKLHGFRCNGG